MEFKNNLRGHLFLPAIIVLIVIIVINQKFIDEKFDSSKKVTIGKVTEVYYRYKQGGNIKFKFLVDGKWIDGLDPQNPSFPKYVREEEPIIGKYYQVEYNPKDLSDSKIMITQKKLTDNELKSFGIE
ncbi:hypothetical protein [Winogradskyella aquimaris]|uniref:DUF3592 domain-containing protein n=1 Tax=Winogradskyella aquimaris TaxID=864074 RepID=A0ABU5ER41_9FLAO|nr:hypothetical protein [Winogradskyella aquimaris]MDY2588521.1 hypothetical protein [Winogradskyella aquimaris]